EFFDVYLELAVEFRLPIRLGDASTERSVGFPFRKLAAEEGVIFPDRCIRVKGASRRAIEAALIDLAPGVTEVHLHPAIDSAEFRSLAPDWPAGVDDLDLLTAPGGLGALARRSGVGLIGYRPLRDLQRSGGGSGG
ncbi:MAG: hypothetical protein M3144_08815, partial [Actinomycetota bacterium]|nr:hypothetical protein [Actinomycetota bacterium]